MSRSAAFRKGLEEILLGPRAPLALPNLARLMSLALVLVLLAWAFPPSRLSEEEGRVWDRVRSAQDALQRYRRELSIVSTAEEDPHQTGLIGVEWSPLTTTLGSLKAKQLSTDPLWAVLFLRWFDEVGLREGDKVFFFSSASFPGLLLAGLVAAEERGLDVTLAASLSASTWGANIPDLPLPALLRHLRLTGHLATKALFYTLGGDDEEGKGLAPEALDLLRQAAADEGVPLLAPGGIDAVIAAKMEALQAFSPRLVVQIGGSRANLGDDPAVLDLAPGLLKPPSVGPGGDGLLGLALERGYPVIHLLNLGALARREGMPSDGKPRRRGPGRWPLLRAGLGGLALVCFLGRYRRWEVAP